MKTLIKHARSQTGKRSIKLYEFSPPHEMENFGGKTVKATHEVRHCVIGHKDQGYCLTEEPDFAEICKRSFNGSYYKLTEY